MYCPHCGKENDSAAKFCTGCGNPLHEDRAADRPSAPPQASPAPAKSSPLKKSTPPEKSRRGMRRLLFILLPILAVVLVAAIFLLRRKPTIDLNKYVRIRTEGYDGYGKATAEVDWLSIEADYGHKIKVTEAYLSTLTKVSKESQPPFNLLMLTAVMPVDVMKMCVQLDVSPKNGLKNGDTVHYTWTIAPELSTYLTCNVVWKDGDHTVEGLTSLATFDGFSGLSVAFDGTSPDGVASLHYEGGQMEPSDFSLDRTENLRNGDVVKVKISDKAVERCAQSMGKIPEVQEKEFPVSGLPSYVTSASELDAELLSLLQSEAVDAYRAYVAKNWSEGAFLTGMTYVGNYLLTPKDPGETPHNRVVLVYKITAELHYANGKKSFDQTRDILWAYRANDVGKDAEGKPFFTKKEDNYHASIEIDTGIPERGLFSFGDKAWTLKGYATIDELEREEVQTMIDRYKCEATIDKAAATTSESPATTTTVEEKNERAEPGAPKDGDASSTSNTASSSGYVLPHSSSSAISRADLQGLSAWQCRIARNEIFARHGRKFQDEDLQKYFDGCDWYRGTIAPGAFDNAVLSDIEKKNLDVIANYEKEMGYR